VDIRQLAKVQVMSWRKYCGLSPIGESPGGVLAKVMWTFSIGESHIGEIWVSQKKSEKNKSRPIGIDRALSVVYKYSIFPAASFSVY
jgi:hypothetical protein